MKIVGVGVDLVSISRFIKLLDKFKTNQDPLRFARRIFSDYEMEHAPVHLTTYQLATYFASRWACKEAVVKSIGQGGFSTKTFYAKKVSDSKQPQVYIEKGSAMEQYIEKELQMTNYNFYLSLSHEHEYCIAHVTLVKE